MQYNQTIQKNKIQQLIPHAGSMCLLDKVVKWDEKKIICLTNTHLKSSNPLRFENGLPVYALIEYGAQAMAIHGGIIAKLDGQSIKEGYLVALRDVKILKEDINFIRSALCIEANQQMASEGNMIYSFSITAENELLLSGRATVVAVYNN